MKKCLICKKDFERPLCYSNKQWLKRKYCSPKCARSTYSTIRNAQWADPKYRKMMSDAHIGQKAWNKGKRVLSNQREKHPNWKGDQASYVHKHTYVYRHKMKPKKCRICKQGKKLEWSNKDHKYSRDLKDYQAICRSCHRQYDKKYNNKKHA